MEKVNSEGVKMGMVSCHRNGIHSESKLDYNCQHSTGLQLLAISRGLEIIHIYIYIYVMWTDMSDT